MTSSRPSPLCANRPPCTASAFTASACSTTTAIGSSKLRRRSPFRLSCADAQNRYSHYLNVKYKDTPWALIAPLYGVRNIDHFAPYLRSGPVNWTPRFDARFLDLKGFREFLRYLENNPVKAGLAHRAIDWPWSSAKAHCTGVDDDHLLTFEVWQHIFGNPETIVHDWQIYLNSPLDEARENAARLRNLHTSSRRNRPMGWLDHASPPM